MFKDKIKEICKERGMSVKELERQSGLGEGTIKKWSEFYPRVDSLMKVASVLGVTIDELIKEETA